MNLNTRNAIFDTVVKLQKVRSRIVKMNNNGTFNNIPLYKRNAILKRHNRYFKKLIAINNPLSRAVSIIGLSLLFSVENFAQCDSFANAEISNPLKQVSLPIQLNRPVFIDIDNDGDLDCYAVYQDLHDSARFAFLENTGTKKYPDFHPNTTRGGFPDSTDIYLPTWEQTEGMVFADIDGDGDYDCFIGNYDWVEYFKNEGDKTHPVFIRQSDSENPLNFLRGSYGLYFNLVDIDADGDYDLFANNLYYANFYENKGTKNNPVFVRVAHRLDISIYSHYIFEDLNEDGLTDAIQSSSFFFPTTTVFYKNDGTADKPHFTKYSKDGVFPFKNDHTDYVYSLVDLNSDGFPEAFSSNGEYAVTSPIASIVAKDHEDFTKLDAYPKGDYTYKWTLNGKIIPKATNDFIRVTCAGNYAVEITDSCGTGISLPYKLQNTTDVISARFEQQNLSEVNDKNISLQLFPNPFKDRFVLKFNKGYAKETVVYVSDVRGKNIIALKPQSNTIQLGEELHTGVYFIYVIQNGKVIFRQTVIKQ